MAARGEGRRHRAASTRAAEMRGWGDDPVLPFLLPDSTQGLPCRFKWSSCRRAGPKGKLSFWRLYKTRSTSARPHRHVAGYGVTTDSVGEVRRTGQ